MFKALVALKTPECEVFVKDVLKGDGPDLLREVRQRSIILAAEAPSATSDAEREPLEPAFKSFDRNASRAQRNCANLRTPDRVITIRECELKADAVHAASRIREELRKDG